MVWMLNRGKNIVKKIRYFEFNNPNKLEPYRFESSHSPHRNYNNRKMQQQLIQQAKYSRENGNYEGKLD